MSKSPRSRTAFIFAGALVALQWSLAAQSPAVTTKRPISYVVRNVRSGQEFRHPRGTSPSFTPDGKFVVFTIAQPKADEEREAAASRASGETGSGRLKDRLVAAAAATRARAGRGLGPAAATPEAPAGRNASREKRKDPGADLINALRRLGKEGYMFTFNGERHGLRNRDNMKYWTVHPDGFFDHYLLGKPRPEWMDKGVPYQERGKRDVLPLFKRKTATSTTTQQERQ